MKTAVYGNWHLAEVYAVGLCELGHEVVLISDDKIAEDYRKGKPPVFEPGITEGINKYVSNGKLSFSSNIKDPKNKAGVCFLAEDCKVTKSGIDMGDIEEKFSKLVRSNNFKIISVSSQLPIGTCSKWQNKNKGVKIVYYPEFLRLGNALKLFTEPDYFVLGGDKKSTEKVYAFFAKVDRPKFSVTLEEAEMSKHAANIFVAMTVSFVSELTKFSEKFNINLERIGEILRNDKRVGPKSYTMPGMGFSGETVERDIRVLISEAKKIGKKLPMFEQVIAVNNEHNKFVENELRRSISSMKGKKLGFIGATYKPFTSTLRGSLIAPIMNKLAKEGANIALYDPLVENNPYKVATIAEAFSGAEAVVISVNKKEFKEADYGRLLRKMKKRRIIDAANMFRAGEIPAGADYSSIGRGKQTKK